MIMLAKKHRQELLCPTKNPYKRVKPLTDKEYYTQTGQLHATVASGTTIYPHREAAAGFPNELQEQARALRGLGRASQKMASGWHPESRL